MTLFPPYFIYLLNHSIRKKMSEEIFILAILEDNILKIKKMLERGFCVTDDCMINDELVNPLITIIREDKVKVMDFIISYGSVNCDFLIRGEISLLIHSIVNGSKEMTYIILKNGADVRKCDTIMQSPPVTYAIAKGNHEALEMLLERDREFNLSVLISGKYPPIFVAAMCNNDKAIITLLNYGSWKRYNRIYFLDLIKDKEVKNKIKFFMKEWDEKKYGSKKERKFYEKKEKESSSSDEEDEKGIIIFRTFQEFLRRREVEELSGCGKNKRGGEEEEE